MRTRTRRVAALVAAFVGTGFGENRREALARARQNALWLARTAGFPSIGCQVVLSGCVEPTPRVVRGYVVLGCRRSREAVAPIPVKASA
ncbi:hypothetical protein N8J89_35500 [Crossiella sp. CA-258035]|uniref:hypothetical protein n=1 Tax=Crossiella sp. CA-258035 TaxID=2981138 RepID=UPI0024BC84F7|nr:hypothetical protein [Crossiella sp. CA-258035]WHT18364.1 hypothetical protein N8J89_35500 [Crossiella sp. CA-258035]